MNRDLEGFTPTHVPPPEVGESADGRRKREAEELEERVRALEEAVRELKGQTQ